MNTNPSLKNSKYFDTKHIGVCFTATLAIAALAGRAAADPPLTMAPPIQSSIDQTAADVSGDASQDSVFNWAEVPENQTVPIRRAVFDQGGYQLYDAAGETIIVPFANQNLYVMKFGISDNDSTYFVNTGDAPVLYLPKGASLENLSVPGARWYPFSQDFHPAEPVFLGIAPSYPEFINMGWYPDMYAYGGYYGRHSFLAGGLFLPTIGLEFVIGGRSYGGWQSYHHYYHGNPAPYRVTIVNRNIYRGGYDRHYGEFRGASGHGGYANHSFGGGHEFGNSHSYGSGHTFGGSHTYANGHTFEGSGHQFNAGSHQFNAGSHQFNAGSHQFDAGSHQAWAHRTFNGASHNFNSVGISRNSNNVGPSHNFNNSEVSHNNEGRTFGGGHSFQGAQPGSFGGSHGSDSGHGTFGGNTRQSNEQSRPVSNGSDRHASFTGGGGRQGGGGNGHQGGGGDHSSSRGGDNGHDSHDSHR